MPLLEGTDARAVDGRLAGQKMSKSLGNAIGVDEPPAEMYGKLMAVPDEVMVRYAELLSLRGGDLAAEVRSGSVHPMEAKKRLASELVERFHGPDAARQAMLGFEQRFQRRELPTEIPEVVWTGDGDRVWICRLLVDAGLAKSNGEARRLLSQGAVSLSGERVTDATLEVPCRGRVLLEVGKRRIARILFPAEE
jgi:tyrosyl-tRNA synthetase